MKHINNGECPKCKDILENPVGTHEDLVKWFISFQKDNADAHISYSYRNKEDQELFFKRKTSNAHYGESPHNYSPSLAIDVFRLSNTGLAEFIIDWYLTKVMPSAEASGLELGGKWIKLKDFPHFQVAGWKQLVKDGKAKLI